MLIKTWYQSSAMAAVLSANHRSFISPMVLVPIGIIVLLCLWRLWKFKICPHFYTDNPKELPYWAPCMCAGSCTILLPG